MNDKILSIYIPTYNRADIVVKQLKFLLDEMKELDEEKIEIVVNDNCSSDNTQGEVLKCIENTSVIYHRNDRNLGIVGNVYAAAEFVTGKHLWIIGDDDILFPGTVKRVYDILNKYSNVSYIYLNYAPLDQPQILSYDGPGGLIEDGAAMMTGSMVGEIDMVVLTSANIYSTEAFVEAVQAIPIETEESYGINGYASLASMKKGESFFESKLWVHNDRMNMSWKDIKYESNMGMLRMFRKLTMAGYSKKEISSIYQSWITDTVVIRKILRRLILTKNFKRYFKDTLFCFAMAPRNVIIIYWNRVVITLNKIFKRR